MCFPRTGNGRIDEARAEHALAEKAGVIGLGNQYHKGRIILLI